MIGQAIRAQAWKWAAIVCAVLAVAAVIACLFLGWRGAADRLRADAAEQRAEALAGQVRALKAAQARDDASADATDAARDSAAKRQPEQAARAARVKSYADSAGDACRADPRIVRELEAGADRIRAAESGLRGDGRPEGKGPKPADG